MTHSALYYLAAAALKGVQCLPLAWLARFGQGCGWLAYFLDRPHRRVAVDNLSKVFGKEKTAAEIRRLARLNFIRIGENYCCAIKTSAMSKEQLESCLEWKGLDRLEPRDGDQGRESKVVAIGHFGNFELWVHITKWVEGYRGIVTYRALEQPYLNRLMQSQRERSGCCFYERRSESDALKKDLSQPGFLMGLLMDQHGRSRGIWLPFLGRPCSYNPSAAVLALRYKCDLHTGFCYRVGLGRWRIEIEERIPLKENGRRRSLEAILQDVNQSFEQAVLRDPANWFWVHKRWKPLKNKNRGKGKEG